MRRRTPLLFVAFAATVLVGACEHIDTAPTADPSVWPGTVPPPPPPPNPRIQFTKYIAFGDSFTEGFLKGQDALTVPYFPNIINGDVDPRTAGPSTGFPYKLKSLLEIRYVEQTFVMFDAGWATRRAEREIIEDRINAVLSFLPDKPEVMLLLEGVNDLAEGDSISHTVGYLQALKNEAQSRGMKVLVLTYPPETSFKGPGNPTIIAFNDAIKTQFGADVIDIYPAIPTSMVGPDGEHLTELGNQTVAETIFARLQELYEIPLGSK